MASEIGIKLADGSFFPILNEGPSNERDLELTTMRDDQESVQINLFKRIDELEPEYIGSLIVEDLAQGSAGDPTINLKIKLDEEENLSAEAIDMASGSKQSLKVSLKTLSDEAFDIPDFDLSVPTPDLGIGEDPDREDVFIPDTDPDDFIIDEETIEESTEEDLFEEEPRKKKFPLWAIILLILLCIGALVLAILLLIKPAPDADKNKIASTDTTKVVKTNNSDAIDQTTEKAPKEDPDEKAAAEAKQKAEEEAKQRAEAEAKKKAEEEAKRKAEEEAAKKKAEEEAKRKAAAKKKTPKINSEGVVRYRLKWGDTLWDLSETFYKTPWKYKRIADYNKIRNPNVIIAGTYIEIPAN